MASKKKDTTGNRNRLGLPFGDHSDHGWHTQEHKDNVVCLSQRTQEKERSTRIEHRKNIARKLIDYAESLDW